MKVIVFFLIVSCSVLVSCKSNTTSESTETSTIDTQSSIDSTETSTVNQNDTSTVSYYCPMKCEKDKVYAEAGQCPVCKMDLEKVVTE